MKTYLLLLFFAFANIPIASSQCFSSGHDNSPLTGWLSCIPSPNPNPVLGDGHWILLDLGKVHQIENLEIWNYNEFNNESNGISEIRIDYGVTLNSWFHFSNMLLSIGSGQLNLQSESTGTWSASSARYILLSSITNHGGSCHGLAEIRINLADDTSCDNFQVAVTTLAPSCPDITNGSMSATPVGGASPYSYEWSTGSTDAFIEDLSDGQYSVQVTDALGCVQAIDIPLTDPSNNVGAYNSLPIPTDHYYDANTISSQGKVAYNGTVQFSSSISVELEEDFEIINGGQFSASVEDCIEQNQTASTYISSDISNPHEDYLGGGHLESIIVSASDEAQSAKAINVIGGQGLLPDTAAYARFLSHATFGGNQSMIHDIDSMGIESWLDWQCDLPRQDFMATFQTVLDSVYEDPGNGLIGFQYFRMAWWNNMLTGEDYLRDRLAFHLTQLFVVSDKSDLMNLGEGLASYYDLIHEHALGNFRDLLFHVTMHPSMGLYLSHLNNPKADTSLNQFPDENYAREVMQLFTIGLLELESNGVTEKDLYGNEIPTYSNDEVIEFSKIFTGLGFDHPMAEFGSRRFYDMTIPMIMYEDFHEPGPKYLLNGDTIPSGQTGMQDINDAVDNLFYHQNTAPFVCRRLIQYLVTSNPSIAYVQRVVDVFVDNGTGTRGDMKSVVRAILTDPEARDCYYHNQPDYGKLVEPMVRYLHLLKALNVFSSDGTFYSVGGLFQELTFQAPLGAPSVFNFFSPDYVPSGLPQGTILRAPEFQILNSYTAVGNYNLIDIVKNNQQVLQHENAIVQLDISEELALAADPEALIDHLDLLFTYGQLSDETRGTILFAMNQLNTSEDRLKMAFYLLLTSPEYVIGN